VRHKSRSDSLIQLVNFDTLFSCIFCYALDATGLPPEFSEYAAAMDTADVEL